MNWSEYWIEHEQNELRVRQIGPSDGRMVVMLPSLGRGGQDFDDLAKRVAAAGYLVTLPEPRGVGGSKGILVDQTLHDFAADVGAVIEQMAPSAVTIVGHAYGNRVARTVAADRPELVDRLVLIAAGGI